MNTAESHTRVVRYYTRLGTWLGYDLILGGAKHLGYYPNGIANISERDAQKHMHDALASRLNLQENQLVLDAGCGQGVVSADLARRYGVRVVGITIVPFEIDRAKKVGQKLGVHNKTEYHLMDYSATNFLDNHFDAIYTSETLSHSPDVGRTLRELYRILKPGGALALLEYTLAPDEQFTAQEKNAWRTIVEYAALHGLHEFRHGTFPLLLRRSGFTDVEEENITDKVRPSILRLHRLARIIYPLVRLLRLERHFINTTAGYWWYDAICRDLFRVCLFTAKKP